MSAQPDHPAPLSPSASATNAAAQLRAQLATDRRARRWVPAFERDWAAALEDARTRFSLGALHDVGRTWQAQRAAAPAVDAFVASGMDDSDGIALEDALGARP